MTRISNSDYPPSQPPGGPSRHCLRVSDLNTAAPTGFEIVPEADELMAIADGLGLAGLRKLRFKGTIEVAGEASWRLNARLGATVVQPCVATLEPVVSRLEGPVERLFSPDFETAGRDSEPDSEVEMPDDDTLEPLGKVIDLGQILTEALAIMLPLYPRSPGAEVKDAQFSAPGTAPMRDEDALPFAGLASLRDKLKSDD